MKNTFGRKYMGRQVEFGIGPRIRGRDPQQRRTLRVRWSLLQGLATLAVVAMAVPAVAYAEPQQSGAPAVAGVAPSKRPPTAPKISTAEKGADWYERALTGLTRPYPTSFRFLEDQGAWYTPFTRPGMTGRYDIRGWHQKPAGM